MTVLEQKIRDLQNKMAKMLTPGQGGYYQHEFDACMTECKKLQALNEPVPEFKLNGDTAQQFNESQEDEMNEADYWDGDDSQQG